MNPRFTAVLVSLLLFLLPGGVAYADSHITVLNRLNVVNVYIDPAVISSGHAVKGDSKKIDAAINAAGSHGVPAKVALVMSYPNTIHNPQDGADHLRAFLDFSGVLVLVTPHGVGISSDYFSSSTSRTLQREAAPQCAQSYTACAIAAVRSSIPKVQAEQSVANRNVAIFWVIAVILFMVLIGGLIYIARREQRALPPELGPQAVDDAPSTPAPEAG